VCQVKLGTARLMGFKGKEQQLIDPKTNINYAAKYLAYQLKRYKGDYKKAIVSYNRGSYNKDEVMSYSGKVALAFLTDTLKGKK
jgi:soluble lytic murein transglycosylase-like protein